MTGKEYGDQPAFPHELDQKADGCAGMTIRDVFAGRIAAGVAGSGDVATIASDWCIQEADALCDQLAKETTDGT